MGQVGLLTAAAATLGYYSADGASGSADSSSNTLYYSADGASGSVDSSNTLYYSADGHSVGTMPNAAGVIQSNLCS